MDIAAAPPAMTREKFFAWAERQEGRHEFDGERPVAVTGGTNNHGRIARNLNAELFLRLRGTGCESMLSEGGGVATTGNRVRYPDATVTCSPMLGKERLIPDPVAVFEVVSPSSVRIDGVLKLREYLAVPSIQHCVLIEQDGIGLTVHARHGGAWVTTPLVEGETLSIPGLGLELAVASFYAGVTFGDG